MERLHRRRLRRWSGRARKHGGSESAGRCRGGEKRGPPSSIKADFGAADPPRLASSGAGGRQSGDWRSQGQGRRLGDRRSRVWRGEGLRHPRLSLRGVIWTGALMNSRVSNRSEQSEENSEASVHAPGVQRRCHCLMFPTIAMSSVRAFDSFFEVSFFVALRILTCFFIFASSQSTIPWAQSNTSNAVSHSSLSVHGRHGESTSRRRARGYCGSGGNFG